MKRRTIGLYLFLLSIVTASFLPFASAQEAFTCSTSGTDAEISTSFYNNLGFDITIHWINYECQEAVDGSLIASGEDYPVTTYDGHEFIIRSEGEMIGYYVASSADNGGDVALSDYLGLAPDWSGADETITEEEAPAVETIITLVPIDESILPTEACSADETIEINQFHLWNDTGTDNEIYLYWLNTECQEEELYLYPDDYHYRFDVAYVGDDLVFRNTAGELLAYYQVGADDAEKWVNLTDIITVETTVFEVEIADLSALIEASVNARRQELQMEALSAHSTLETVAQEAATGFDPANFSLLEQVGDVSTFDLSENGYSLEIAEGWGLAGTINSLAVYKESGLTDADIQGVFDILLSYEGWTDGEIESFGVYQSDNLFILITSDVIEEEWATFEYEGDTPNNYIESTVTTQFSRENGVPTYVFDAQAGLTYVLWYQSDEYDTYLYLDDPNGIEIASNDDSAGDLNSLIVFVPTVSGRYTARLDSYASDASGDFTFAIATPDSVISSHVAPQTPATLVFDVVEGTTYIISAESAEIDTVLSVIDANGVVFASNDDFAGSTNSFAFFTAPTTATFTVSVDSYNQQAGSVRIYTGSFKND